MPKINKRQQLIIYDTDRVVYLGHAQNAISQYYCVTHAAIVLVLHVCQLSSLSIAETQSNTIIVTRWGGPHRRAHSPPPLPKAQSGRLARYSGHTLTATCGEYARRQIQILRPRFQYERSLYRLYLEARGPLCFALTIKFGDVPCLSEGDSLANTSFFGVISELISRTDKLHSLDWWLDHGDLDRRYTSRFFLLLWERDVPPKRDK